VVVHSGKREIWVCMYVCMYVCVHAIPQPLWQHAQVYRVSLFVCIYVSSEIVIVVRVRNVVEI